MQELKCVFNDLTGALKSSPENLSSYLAGRLAAKLAPGNGLL
jgi:hypothetical protein